MHLRVLRESGFATVRAAGARRLYAVDGALFPTASGYNPTLTIEALAYMSADAIVNRYRKSPGPLI